MITAEERESIVSEAIERALLSIPEVIGNLISSHVSHTKVNKKFYEDYPDLAQTKDIVASVVEVVDSENPGMDYEKLLKKALPKIRERILVTKDLNITTVKEPERDLDKLDLGKSDLGEL